MLETPHVVVGAAIASKIPNPWIALPLAFASHFILDKVPHWNPHLNTELKKYGTVSLKSTWIIAIDVALSLIIGLSMATTKLPDTNHFWLILMGGLFGVLPDIIEGPYFFFGIKTKFIDKWIKFQKSIQVDTSIIPGLATQIATVLASLYWIR